MTAHQKLDLYLQTLIILPVLGSSYTTEQLNHSSCLWLWFHILFLDVFVYVESRTTERGREKTYREILHLLVHCPHGYNSLGWTGLKPGSKSLFWFFHVPLVFQLTQLNALPSAWDNLKDILERGLIFLGPQHALMLRLTVISHRDHGFTIVTANTHTLRRHRRALSST